MSKRTIACLFVGGLLAAVAPAMADFLDEYKAGLEAAEAKKWPAVAQHMRAAIAEQPKEDARLGKRLYMRRYVPHYYLGRALFEQGDCPGALKAWQQSQAQGVIQKFPEHAELEQRKAQCEQRLAAQAKGVRDAEAALATGQEAAEALAGLPGPELAATWEDGGAESLARQAAAARQALDRAKSRFAARGNPPDPAILAEVQELAREAVAGFKAVVARADELRAERETKKQGLLTELAPLVEQARAAIQAAEALRPFPARLGRRVEELQALVAATSAPGPATTPEDLERLKDRITTAIDELRRTSAAPPQGLVNAADAFFRGEYTRVLELLGEETFGSSRAAAHAHLFRAAARYALYVTGGEQDTQLLTAARADVAACRAADAKRLPDRSAFSPRFIQFFLTENAPEPRN